MNLLFTMNKGYMEHVCDCIKSILRFPSEDGYDIYIMHSDLEEQDQILLSGQVEQENAMLHFVYVDPFWF